MHSDRALVSAGVELSKKASEDGGPQPASRRGQRKSTALGDAIILVHGTWANDATWINDTSTISLTLKAQIAGATVIPFRWSGRNSPKARSQAGNELGELGASLYAQGFETIWLIGHSHGGNVALLSLRNAAMREAAAGICFLGTPFLNVRPRPVERFSNVVTQTMSWMALFPGYLPYGAMALTTFLGTLSAFAGGFMLFLGNAMLVLVYLILRPRIRRVVHRHLQAFLVRAQDSTFRRLSAPNPECPCLIAYISWDEAGFVLRTFDKLTLLPWKLFALAAQFVSLVVAGSIAAFFCATVIHDSTVLNLHSSSLLTEIGTMLPLMILVSPIVITPIVAFLRGNPVAFGYEGMLGAATLHIEPSHIPQWAMRGAHEQFVALSTPGLRGLRHSSFYDNDTVIHACADWILKKRNQAELPDVRPSVPSSVPKKSAPKKKLLAFAAIFVALLGVNEWRMMNEIREASVLKFDEEQNSALLGNHAVPLLDVDKDMPGSERDMGVDTVPSETIDPKFVIKKDETCIVEGRFSFSNWGTTVGIALHNTTAAEYTGSDFDANTPNHLKRVYGFFNEKLYNGIWEWYSARGTEVRFSRVVLNDFDAPGTLLIKIWNESRDPVHIRGTVNVACGNG